jgi:selenoprotein W-related protein
MKNYQVIVEFCMQWNYAPKAASFAEELFTHFNRNIQKLELIPVSGGAFEVTLNGEKIYSKLETGVFPDTEEMIQLIESK